MNLVFIRNELLWRTAATQTKEACRLIPFLCVKGGRTSCDLVKQSKGHRSGSDSDQSKGRRRARGLLDRHLSQLSDILDLSSFLSSWSFLLALLLRTHFWF